MKFKLITLFVIHSFLCLFSSTVSKAQSPTILGGDIVYECIGVNSYRISLNVYTDCKGGALPDSTKIDWTSTCLGGITDSINLSKMAGFPLDITTSIFSGASACNGGTGDKGVEHYLYTGMLTLSSSCPSIEMSWSSCCRSDSLISIVNPGTSTFYIETILSQTTPICNSSVQFLNLPIVGSCTNFPWNYQAGAFDPDGDTLRYSLVPCQEANNTPVSYFPGFSGIVPFGVGNMVIVNAQTGMITYTIPANANNVFCILVEEIRGGVVIGSTMREITIVGLNCMVNNPPVITGIDSTNHYDTTVLVGQPFCFDIHGEDLDSSQQLVMMLQNGITGSTFTIDSSNNPIGTFCWTPTSQDTGQHTFVVQLSDNATPVPGVVLEQFTINVTTVLGQRVVLKEPHRNPMRVYPNPAWNNVQIAFEKELEGGVTLKIINTQGQLVWEQERLENNRLDVNLKEMHSGFYTIIAVDKKGMIMERQRLIIQ